MLSPEPIIDSGTVKATDVDVLLSRPMNCNAGPQVGVWSKLRARSQSKRFFIDLPVWTRYRLPFAA